MIALTITIIGGTIFNNKLTIVSLLGLQDYRSFQ